jgi:hypothetical protein
MPNRRVFFFLVKIVGKRFLDCFILLGIDRKLYVFLLLMLVKSLFT